MDTLTIIRTWPTYPRSPNARLSAIGRLRLAASPHEALTERMDCEADRAEAAAHATLLESDMSASPRPS